jgi:glycosyltransferase involved in cell wall biosynthesis
VTPSRNEAPLTILSLMDSRSVSGPVRQLAAVIQPLAARGYQLQILTFQRHGAPPNEAADFLRAAGAPVTIIEERHRCDRALLSKVDAVIAAIRPDIVQTHSYRPSFLLALRTLRRQGRMPWIGYFHGSTAESWRVRLYHQIDQMVLRLADLVIVMAERQRREKAHYRTEVRIISNAAIQLLATTAVLPIESAALRTSAHPRVGVIGRLSPEKGVDIMLTAWAQCVRNGQAGTLIIAGNGPERDTLERQAVTLAVGDRVVWLGHLPDTRDLYTHLDLVVIPSRSEGLPNVFLESLSHAVPVVSTRVGALPELVGTTPAAVLVDIEDPAALAAAIQARLAIPESDAARHARIALLDRLSLENRVEAIIRSYEDVLRAARSTG